MADFLALCAKTWDIEWATVGSAFALPAGNGNNSMAKLLLLSTVISMIGIPIACANAPSPRRGLQRAVVLFFVYNLFYVFAVRYIYPHLL